MGPWIKLVDAILFIFFLIIAIAAPLIDFQTILPLDLYPTFLVDLKSWYAKEYGDFLVSEKPSFFVGIVWVEMFLQWPFAIASLYAIVMSKSWLNTTSLVYGGSCLSTMAAIMAEILGSERPSEKLQMMYFPFMVFAALALLRGLLPINSGKTVMISRRPILNRKKRT
ncbi:hypothetical protein Leryth_011072 [Lithospermum erythrorhizon]|nr:hypothetical protein Leryth_011072 [Lithospermum erythrorhizon]